VKECHLTKARSLKCNREIETAPRLYLEINEFAENKKVIKCDQIPFGLTLSLVQSVLTHSRHGRFTSPFLENHIIIFVLNIALFVCFNR
jgi:hypothetical protein